MAEHSENLVESEGGSSISFTVPVVQVGEDPQPISIPWDIQVNPPAEVSPDSNEPVGSAGPEPAPSGNSPQPDPDTISVPVVVNYLPPESNTADVITFTVKVKMIDPNAPPQASSDDASSG